MPVIPNSPVTDTSDALVTYDFNDGNGPVPAHRHPNGGGWVADTATVASTAYVGPQAQVYGYACVTDTACICGVARVSGNSVVSGNARVSDAAHVTGNARVSDAAHVSGDANVTSNGRVSAGIVRSATNVDGGATTASHHARDAAPSPPPLAASPASLPVWVVTVHALSPQVYQVEAQTGEDAIRIVRGVTGDDAWPQRYRYAAKPYTLPPGRIVMRLQ